MHRHAGVVAAAAALVLGVGVGSLYRSPAQERAPEKAPAAAREEAPAGPTDRADDRAALRKRTEEILKAADRADAKELAAFWTETGEYVRGDDLTIRGRANIEKAYADRFKAKKSGTVELHGESARFLSDDTAVLEGTFLVKRPNPAEESRSRFSALFVRVKGQWYLGLLREWAEGPSLQELAWLVGTWTSRHDDAEVKAVFEWTEDKTFLRGRFSTKREGRTVTGFQVLALDPATKALRSWTFEGGGGLGEAAWTRTAKGWAATSTAVTPDGERVTATTELTPIDANSFTWKSVDRTVGGEKVPDVGPVKVVRDGPGK
jgi:uncharacterized protein (TIGR02246 family)